MTSSKSVRWADLIDDDDTHDQSECSEITPMVAALSFGEEAKASAVLTGGGGVISSVEGPSPYEQGNVGSSSSSETSSNDGVAATSTVLSPRRRRYNLGDGVFCTSETLRFVKVHEIDRPSVYYHDWKRSGVDESHADRVKDPIKVRAVNEIPSSMSVPPFPSSRQNVSRYHETGSAFRGHVSFPHASHYSNVQTSFTPPALPPVQSPHYRYSDIETRYTGSGTPDIASLHETVHTPNFEPFRRKSRYDRMRPAVRSSYSERRLPILPVHQSSQQDTFAMRQAMPPSEYDSMHNRAAMTNLYTARTSLYTPSVPCVFPYDLPPHTSDLPWQVQPPLDGYDRDHARYDFIQKQKAHCYDQRRSGSSADRGDESWRRSGNRERVTRSGILDRVARLQQGDH
ncbi:hypothetical protein CBS101457_003493 [Exobasidium rhododendri]|nr:hypothetical protein CBS101457_003493 [Exobasidium rhododendri]